MRDTREEALLDSAMGIIGLNSARDLSEGMLFERMFVK